MENFRKIKVYVGLGDKRRVVECDLVEDREKIVVVRLPDGNLIKRKKSRDVYEG